MEASSTAATTSATRQSGGTAKRKTPLESRDNTVLLELLGACVGELSLIHAPSGRDALEVAGRLATSSTWAGYRAGRQRLASLAGVYLSWLAPPEPWAATNLGGGRLVWENGGVVLGDQLVAVGRAGNLVIKDVRDAVDAQIAQLAAQHGEAFVGVRVLALGGPMVSQFWSSDGTRSPLPDTPWCFDWAGRNG